MFRDRATLGFKVWARGLGFRALHLGFVLMWWSRSLSLFLALSNFERERERGDHPTLPLLSLSHARSLARALSLSLSLSLLLWGERGGVGGQAGLRRGRLGDFRVKCVRLGFRVQGLEFRV